MFDWFIVIDNTFTYLDPVNVSYPLQLLQSAFDAIRPGGRIILDFFNYSKREPDVELQQWNAFPNNDPYSYGLYSHRIDNGINTSKTIFIKRNTAEEEIKVELSKVYSLNEITILLESVGFSIDEIFSTFSEDPFVENESERLVIIGKKNIEL